MHPLLRCLYYSQDFGKHLKNLFYLVFEIFYRCTKCVLIISIQHGLTPIPLSTPNSASLFFFVINNSLVELVVPMLA